MKLSILMLFRPNAHTCDNPYTHHPAAMIMTSWKCPSGCLNMPLYIQRISKSVSHFMDSDSYAYVTLLTKTSYLAGVLVLDYCLRSVKSRYPLVVMVTPSLPGDVREILTRRQIQMIDVEPLNPPAGKHTLDNHDARFADTWTKLRCICCL